MFNHVTCFVSAALFGLVFGMFFMRSRGSFARTRYVWLLFPFSQLVAVLIAIAYGYAANMPFGYFCFVAFLSAVCAAVDMFLLLALDLISGGGSASESSLVEERLSYLRAQIALQERYNRKYRKSLEEAREVKRDIVSLFGRVAEAVGDPEELGQELDRLNMAAKAVRKERVCEHPVVDAILKVKLGECDARGIRTVWRVVIPSDIGVSNVDLCAVFSNLMDNAINACDKVEPERRAIDVRARVTADRLLIEVVNSCGSMVSARPRLREELLSIPSEMAEHGWGFSIMRGIAWGNGGSLETSVENREDMGRVFRATIMLGLGGGVGEMELSERPLPP